MNFNILHRFFRRRSKVSPRPVTIYVSAAGPLAINVSSADRGSQLHIAFAEMHTGQHYELVLQPHTWEPLGKVIGHHAALRALAKRRASERAAGVADAADYGSTP